MKRLITIILLASISPFSFAMELTPQQVLEKVDAIRAPSSDFTFIVTANANQGEVVSEYSVKIQNSTKSLVLYNKPLKNKGRVILLDDRNMWIYIPGTSRAMRISPQQQLVGAASNADISRVVFNIDYDPIAINLNNNKQNEIIELELKAKDVSTPYRKIVLYVAKNDLHPVQADFYAVSGKKLKSISYVEYSTVLGVQRPVKLVITDSVNEGKSTTLTYSNYELEKTPIEFFQPSYLSRLRY